MLYYIYVYVRGALGLLGDATLAKFSLLFNPLGIIASPHPKIVYDYTQHSWSFTIYMAPVITTPKFRPFFRFFVNMAEMTKTSVYERASLMSC